jgi:outer membrane protein
MMKKALKWVLPALLLVAGSTATAQVKLGYINTDELITAMPERDSANVKYEALYAELVNQLEEMQVEYNRQLNTYTQEMSTLTPAVQNVREQGLQDMLRRVQESQQQAEQDLQRNQQELFAPIVDKATATIKKVAKDNGITAVFDVNSIIYYDETTMIDLLPLVKKELGLN